MQSSSAAPDMPFGDVASNASYSNAASDISSSSKGPGAFDGQQRIRSSRLPGYSSGPCVTTHSSHVNAEMQNPSPTVFPSVPNDRLTCPTPPFNVGYNSDSVLTRGLQTPTRGTYITSGFQIPPNLIRAGVSEEVWRQFNMEVKSLGSLSGKQ